MTTTSNEAGGIQTRTRTTIPDFSSLISRNKRYQRSDVTQIVPRDVYKGRQRRAPNGNENENENENGNASNSCSKRVIYKVDKDGISCVSNTHTNSQLGEEDGDYYIVGDDDETGCPAGYDEDEYLVERALSSQTNVRDYLQQFGTVTECSDGESDSKDGSKNEQPQMGEMMISKNPLWLKDQQDFEAMRQDAIKTKEADKLAYQLSLRTTACALMNEPESESVVPPPLALALQTSDANSNNDDLKIMVHTMSQEERIRLENRRKQQEASLPHHLHGIELIDWESKINWEGAVFNDSEANANANQDSNNNNTNNNDASAHPNPLDFLSQPFNISFEGMDLAKLISWEGGAAKPGFNEALGRHLGKIVLQDTVAASSVVKTSGAILNTNPRPFNQSEEFKNRPKKGEAIGPINSLQKDQTKKKKEIEERQKKRAQREKDKSKRIKDVLESVGALDGGTGRAITSSLMGPGGTERTGRPTRHHGSSLAHDCELVDQLDMITNHLLVKPDMSEIELRHYCKPLLPRALFKSYHDIMPWQFQILVTPQKKATNKNAGFQSSMVNVMPGSISQSKIRNIADLCPSEGELILIEYSEEKPPIKLMKGMASKIVNYYKGDKSKCPLSAGGGDRPTKKKKHGLTNQDSDIKGGSSGKVEKPPRLEGPDSATLNTKDLIGKIGTKKHGDGNNSINPSVTIHPEGVTEILKDHGPFLGKVVDGTTITGIVNNLFVAPMFRHDPKPTDFLMILGKRLASENSSRLGVNLRLLPKNIFTAGQTEPKIKVCAPDSKGDKDFVGPFTTYQIAKALQSKQAKERCGLKFEEIRDNLFPYMDIPPNPLRQRIKKVAIYDKNTQIWTLNPNPADDDSIEMLRGSFSPEGVAAYWSARCAERYLKDIGLQDIPLMSASVANIGIVMIYLNGIVTAAKKRKVLMNNLANSRRRSEDHYLFLKAKEKLMVQFEEMKHLVKIANFIYEELQLTPWNLTSDFMDVHRNPQGTGTMKLTGIGDPSGVDAGFNFMRETDKSNKTTAKNDNRDKEEITGTNSDLRKLSMKEMARILLEEYGVKQKKINILARWDRVHMIRELSTKAASDNAKDEYGRYARGEKTKLRDKIDSYKKRIQEIWDRQLTFLKENEEEEALEKSEALLKEDDDSDSESDSDSDDDDDDDEHGAELFNKFQDTGKVNEIVSDRAGADGIGNASRSKNMPSQDTAEEARDLVRFQRENREKKINDEHASKAPSLSKPLRHDRNNGGRRFRNHDRKVIRRKVTKTYPDGTQTVTFQFIMPGDEERISKDLCKSTAKIGSTITKKKTKLSTRRVGHLLFEEDESSIKMVAVKRRPNKGRGRRSDADYIQPRTKRMSGSQGKARQKTENKKPKRKRKKDDEEDEEDRYAKRRGTNNRKEKRSARVNKPHAKMAERLEDIRSSCEKRNSSHFFHRPVDRTTYPNYYEVISNPIDLQTIRDKIKRYEYRTADAFIKDFEVMKDNASKYNGAQHPISNEAAKIYDVVKSTIEANRDEFTSIEIAVKEQFNSGDRKRSRSTTPRDVDSSGNPASVTVDGFEQKVYLGNIKDTAFDD